MIADFNMAFHSFLLDNALRTLLLTLSVEVDLRQVLDATDQILRHETLGFHVGWAMRVPAVRAFHLRRHMVGLASAVDAALMGAFRLLVVEQLHHHLLVHQRV